MTNIIDFNKKKEKRGELPKISYTDCAKDEAIKLALQIERVLEAHNLQEQIIEKYFLYEMGRKWLDKHKY